MCREREVTVDESAFDEAMARQREQARAAGKFKMAQGLEYSGAKTTFHGYEEIIFDDAKVIALYVDGASVKEKVSNGQQAVVVLDHTPFYAESGGQVGDQGVLANASVRFAGDRHAESAGGRRRPSRHARAGHAESRRRREGGNRRGASRPHRAQPLGDPPDAQGTARSTRLARAAEGLAGRRGQNALRLRTQRPDDRRADPLKSKRSSTRKCCRTRRASCA